MLKEISHTSFEQIVGETGALQAVDISFQARVKSVSLLRQDPEQVRQPFSVELQAYDNNNHGQQTYMLSHPGLGENPLFLVPVGPGETGMCYKIVFN